MILALFVLICIVGALIDNTLAWLVPALIMLTIVFFLEMWDKYNG